MSGIVRALERLMLQLGVLSGFATLAIMLIVVLDVAGRSLLGQPIDGGNELSELLLVGLIFLGLASAQQQRHNFAIDMLTRHLPAAVLRWLEALTWTFSLAVVVLLAWLSARQALVSVERSEASYGVISFPIWPARIVIAFGLALLAVQLAFDIVRRVRGRPG